MSANHREVAIGIDVGGTTTKSAVVREGELVERGTVIATREHPGPERLIEVMIEEIARLRARHPEVSAVGVGLPGVVNTVLGIVRDLSNVGGWNDVPLREILHVRTGLPVTIENDANAMAYAELKYGAAGPATNAVCLTLGTGVGGALILNGEIFRGSQFAAGEIGQMSLDWKGRIAEHYANRGSIEKYVGNEQITERARGMYAERFLPPPGGCTPAELTAAAMDGDPIAREVWKVVGDEIGAMLANIVWLLNPDHIVIGGGIADARELLFGPLRESLRSRTMPLIHENLQIVRATLGNDAGMIGSAALARQ